MVGASVGFLLFLSAGLGCGSSAPNNSEGTKQPRVSVDSLRARVGTRTKVASVNGMAIYDDCVRTQAAAHSLSASAALQECIDFELLAQAAQPHLLDQGVQRAGKQALVREFIRQRYPVKEPKDIPIDAVTKLWNIVSTRRKYQHPELRRIAFCRIPLPADEPIASEASLRSKIFLESIYNVLKSKDHLKKTDLWEQCYPVYKDKGIEKLELLIAKTAPRNGYETEFRSAIFDGPQTAGMVLPPLHTKYGWDLILLTQVRKERDTSFAEATPSLQAVLFTNPVYEGWRSSIFAQWCTPFEKEHTISRYAQNIPSPTLPLSPAL